MDIFVPNILIVDDDPNNIRLLEEVARNLGFSSRACTNGPAALRAATLNRPDAILLDIEMPDRDGFEVCARLSETPSLSTVPILFLSGHVDYESKIQAFKAGARDYIEKPFHPTEVAARVALHVQLERAKRLEMNRAEVLDHAMRLEVANREIRNKLSNIIVHDMRSPLTRIFFMFDMLDELQFSETVNKEVTDTIELGRAATENLARHLDEAYGTMDSDKTTSLFFPEVTSTSEIFNRTSALLDDSSSVDFPNEDIELVSDVTLLSRVLLNLCQNSLKAGATKIEIGVQKIYCATEFSIVDNGPGIPEEIASNIFDVGFSTNLNIESLTPSFDRGFGLNFCKFVANQHDGEIWVDTSYSMGCKILFTTRLDLKEN